MPRGGRSAGHFNEALKAYATAEQLPLKYGRVNSQPAQRKGDAERRVEACWEYLSDIIDGKLDPHACVHADEITKRATPPPKS